MTCSLPAVWRPGTHTSSGEVHSTPCGWPTHNGTHQLEPTGTGGETVRNAEFNLLVPSLTANKSTISNWKGLEFATQKHTILAYWLFWDRGTKTTGARKALGSPLFFLKTGDKTLPCETCSPCTWRKSTFWWQRQGVEAEKNLHNQIF